MGRDLPTRRSGVQRRRATQRSRREALSEAHVSEGREVDGRASRRRDAERGEKGGVGFLIRVLAQVIGAAAAVFILYILIQGGPEGMPAAEPGSGDLGDPLLEAEADLAEADLTETELAAAAPSAPAVERATSEPREATVDPATAELSDADPLGLMNALSRAFPESHAALVAELDALAAGGATPTAIARRRSAFIAALLGEKLAFAPYAGSGAHAAYFDANLRLLDSVRERLGVEACAEVVVAGGAALGRRLQDAEPAAKASLLELLADQTAMMLDLARLGADSGVRELATPGGADWRALYRGMEMRGATASQVAMFRDGGLTGAEPLCDVTRIYYQTLLSLEAGAAGRLHPVIVQNTLTPAQ